MQVLRKLKAFTKDLASTNWLMLTGTVTGFITCIVFSICVLLEKTIQLDVWLGWLAFVAGWMGFGVRQFRVKRETYVPLQEAKNAVLQPNQPA